MRDAGDRVDTLGGELVGPARRSPGRWTLEHPGVKAPGTANSTTLPLPSTSVEADLLRTGVAERAELDLGDAVTDGDGHLLLSIHSRITSRAGTQDAWQRTPVPGESLLGPAALLHPLVDERAALLEVAVGEPLGRRRRRRGWPSRRRGRSPPACGRCPAPRPSRSPWVCAKYTRDVGDLGEQVEVGGEAGDGAVEEHQVLHVEHELLRHAGAVAEQRLDDPLHLVHQLVGGERGRVDRRLVEAAGRGSPRRGRCRAGSAPRSRSAASWPFTSLVVAPEHEPQEGQPARPGEPTDDAEVEQGGAAVGHARTGCRRAGRRGRRRGSWRPP